MKRTPREAWGVHTTLAGSLPHGEKVMQHQECCLGRQRCTTVSQNCLLELHHQISLLGRESHSQAPCTGSDLNSVIEMDFPFLELRLIVSRNLYSHSPMEKLSQHPSPCSHGHGKTHCYQKPQIILEDKINVKKLQFF